MPRVSSKKKNNAGQPYPCVSCQDPIKAGEQYYEWSFRYGGTKRQHQAHGHPKQSQLTQSKMSGVYAAMETAEQAIGTSDEASDIAAALNDCANEVEQVKDEYQESIDNLPEQFQQSTPIQEKVDNLDGFVSSLQDAANNIESEEFEEEEPTIAIDTISQSGKTVHEEWEEKREEWLDGLRQQANDALGEFSE